MINNIKSVFTIKDLENLSGIKAHTIRIWEKRYAILAPMRTETNIRVYDLTNLQKLLNITLLHQYGYKISKIATYPSEKIPEMVREIISHKNANNHAISELKIAMMHFDQELFFNTYNWLIREKTFKAIFYDVFVPFLDELGLLWQSETISPAHEHFISYLIKQKIVANTEPLQAKTPQNNSKVFVLSLPQNEIHELGLLFLQYEILQKGYKSIYLGESMPIENLKDLRAHFQSIVFVSFMTVQPEITQLDEYVHQMESELLSDSNEIWLLGKQLQHLNTKSLQSKTLVFKSIAELTAQL
ncbi:MerR family transcriptional regulator [Flavobacterium agrisoli]|uniref:MerR family transcriptional regulator n=1 Tax=Flavobacterium agrisoli TaxID=2793066 RepID=A0A934PQH2_9FLAO|nr:MerR family transcriptional regulator [Flavobacterium agrisoli]MBK0371228.1 MerR family transcriptional regulator [Flavobacterium agrisoli]